MKKSFIFILTAFLLQLFPCSTHAVNSSNSSLPEKTEEMLKNLQIHYISSHWGYGVNSITTIHQDKRGYIWIGTSSGLVRYDGFKAKLYNNTPTNPTLLTGNKINCINDADNVLWIGTKNGINQFNLETGATKHYHFDDFSNSDNISKILITRNGTVWVGTEGGLYQYDKQQDSFTFLCNQRGNSLVPHCAIKSLIEDHLGYVWIGTWDMGLFRYNPESGEYYAVPRFNDLNSAQAVFEDSHHRLWVGTWGKGVYHIINPYDTDKPLRFKNFMSSFPGGGFISDWIYNIQEDRNTGTLWIGTSKGIMLYNDTNGKDRFFEIPKDKLPQPYIFSRGANIHLNDNNGNIWISAIQQGVLLATVRPRNFISHTLPLPFRSEDIIDCIAYDHEKNLWFGLANNGFAFKDKDTGVITIGSDLPAMKNISYPKHTNAIFEDHQRHIIIGTMRNGIIELSSDRRTAVNLNKSNTPWLPDNCVYSFCSDYEKNLLIGTWQGLCVRYVNGKGLYLDTENLSSLKYAQIRHIMQDNNGNIWLSTQNMGIIRLWGDIHNPKSMKMKIYDKPLGTDFVLSDNNKMLQDSKGHIWACSQEVGLMLYDALEDGFRTVNQKFGIPNSTLCSMEEDKDGKLWISSRLNIISLSLNKNGELEHLNFYPNSNNANVFYSSRVSASSADKDICFGGLDSYTTLTETAHRTTSTNTRPYITDIRIFNTSLEKMPEDERNDISDALPPYTNSICLTQSQNDFIIDFSHFSYGNPQDDRFAYYMEGHDKEWIYPTAGTSSAYYCNLPAGTYKFQLKVVDANGTWQEMEQPFIVRILPAIWLRWWAICIYIIIIAAITYFLVKYLKSREEHKRELHLARLSSEKIEELNHKKLQFFTNITHDLMTPLTVISAMISELEMEVPEKKASYQIVRNNLNKQMRLLQQILEFRKAQTGNLQLRVSNGDITEFCKKEVESIQPLMRRNKLHISLLCIPEQIQGYYDSDALDKIIYNLLSNAAKYTQETGFVQVMLELENREDGRYIRLSVKDNGKGIPAERQSNLFKRFYDGEHRKFNTYGTGIGLSLTKDLVTLHHGTISVNSQEGKGTEFIITLPIDRNSYIEEEIDDSFLYESEETANEPHANGDIVDEENNGSEKEEVAKKEHTLLLVEDNDELLSLMRNLLKHQYNIITAYNGKEALDTLQSLTDTQVDLIVTDIMMPVMDGIEMARILKSNSTYHHCPVIMLTAKRDDQDRAEAYDAGADAYITKPFHMSVLQARIQNLLKQRQKVLHEIKSKVFEVFGELNVTNADEEFLKKCIAIVTKHLDDVEFGQEEFASEISTSRSTLYKKIKVLTNMNTTTFIRSIRMKAACDILKKNPNIRVSDLAYAVGYNDPKYFSTCFKKDFGMLPSEYGKTESQE